MTILCFALLAHLALAPPAPGPSPEEVELLKQSLQPEGLAELESHTAAISQLPLSEVEATLDLGKQSVDGHLRLLFSNRGTTPITNLILRLGPNASEAKAQSSLRAEDIEVDGEPTLSRGRGSLLEVDLQNVLQPGGHLVLTLDFHGKLAHLEPGEEVIAPPGRSRARGRSSGTFASSEAGAVLLDWYPVLAARAGEAWDLSEPGTLAQQAGLPPRQDVGSAIVSLAVPRGMRVLGPGFALGQHGNGQGEVAGFALAGLRGALGLVVSGEAEEAHDELHPEGDTRTLRLRVASLHGKQGARAMLTCAREALAQIAQHLGPYPWSDAALIEMPLGSGVPGASATGLSILSRGLGGGVTSPLASPLTATDPLPETPGLFSFSCHRELARQWFPFVVGTNAQLAPWLAEALVEDAAVRVAAGLAGAGEAARFASDGAQRRYIALGYQAMRAMGFKDGRVERRAEDFKSLALYAGLVDGKGPLYLARVRNLVGDAQFDAALRSLRSQRAFRELSGGDLFAALRKASPSRVFQLDSLADRWLRELHGDEDIAPLDATDLLDTLGGGMESASEMAQLFRLLGQISADAQATRRTSADDEKAVRRAMQQLQRSLPELKRLLQQMAQRNAQAP